MGQRTPVGRRGRPNASERAHDAGPRETLRVGELAAGGAAVARRATGETLFVHGAAPGEIVEVVVSDGKPARGRLLRVIEASPHRVTPACPHVSRCGGCDWMHIDGAEQRRAHAAIVHAALAHVVRDDVPSVVAHEPFTALHYRTRARLALRGDGTSVRVGYRAPASRELVPIERCLILAPALDSALTDLPAALAGARGDGEAAIALGAGDVPAVELTWRGTVPASTWAAVDALVREGRWAGARVWMDGAAAPASFGDPRPRLSAADGEPLLVAAGGFSQTSSSGGSDVARAVERLVFDRASEAPHVVELFAGSGMLTVLLARRAASLVAVERDPDAAACMRANLEARSLTAKVVVADADAYAVPKRADVVVLDPPRAGAAGATATLAGVRPRAIVYVACDPATLARDVAVLAGAGYRLEAVETFELFPQTSHVETVVRLARDRRSLGP